MTSNAIIMTLYVIIMTSWHTDIILHMLDNNSWYYAKLIIGASYFPFHSWILLLVYRTKKSCFRNMHRCRWQKQHNSAKTFVITTKIDTKLLNRYKLKLKNDRIHSSKHFLLKFENRWWGCNFGPPKNPK